MVTSTRVLKTRWVEIEPAHLLCAHWRHGMSGGQRRCKKELWSFVFFLIPRSHCFIKACHITRKGGVGVAVPERGSLKYASRVHFWETKQKEKGSNADASSWRPWSRSGHCTCIVGDLWCHCPSVVCKKGLAWGRVWQRCCLRGEGIIGKPPDTWCAVSGTPVALTHAHHWWEQG